MMCGFKKWMVSAILLGMFSINALAQEAGTFTASEPVLITSAGQSADVLMVKILADKAKVAYVFDKSATAAMVDSVKSVILVSGGSSKGLGAASIDKEQELQRVMGIIEKARKNKIPVIAVHVGGKSRRGDLSDYFNEPVVKNADCLVVVKEGDNDSFFTNVAAEKKIPLLLPEKINDVQGIIGKLYGKTSDH